jgi:hypothetical protein
MQLTLLIKIIAILIGITYTLSCTCVRPGTPEEDFIKADLVFLGKIISIKTREHDKLVHFRVNKVYKGGHFKTINITTAMNAGMCGFSFQEKRQYIVYAHKTESGFGTSMCSRTKLVR